MSSYLFKEVAPRTVVKSTQNLEHYMDDNFCVMTKTCRSWRVNYCAILEHISHHHLHHGAGWECMEHYHSLTHFSTTRVIDPSTSASTETHLQGPLATYIIIFFFHNPWTVKKTMILLSLLQSMKCPSGCEWCNRGRTCQRSPRREWVYRHIVRMLAKPMQNYSTINWRTQRKGHFSLCGRTESGCKTDV